MTDHDADEAARYAIRITGLLGPLSLCSLRRMGVVGLESSAATSTVDINVPDADIVDVAKFFADHGIEIESIREITTTG
jgi:hypothetical protein